jgi:hypothetical protein
VADGYEHEVEVEAAGAGHGVTEGHGTSAAMLTARGTMLRSLPLAVRFPAAGR